MRVVIVGAGNVATVFGRLMAATGHEIIQVVSSTIASAHSLAIELGCSFSDNFETAEIPGFAGFLSFRLTFDGK